MDNTVLCYVSMFDANQKIVLPDGKIEYVSVNKISELLPNFCNTYSTNKLHLVGDEQFISGIVEDILSYETINNSIRDLEIEVN